ncbi:MAG: hypothetical protein ABFD44_10690 [Anaerolineaceae bacterium]
MESRKLDLIITIDEADADEHIIDDLTETLRQDLLEMGIEDVHRVHSPTSPAHTKGDPFTIGALALVTLPAFLPKIIECLTNLTSRSENRKVKIKTSAGVEIEFTSKKPLSNSEVLDLVRKLSLIKGESAKGSD